MQPKLWQPPVPFEPERAKELRQQALALRDERRQVTDVAQRREMRLRIYALTGEWWRIVRRGG